MARRRMIDPNFWQSEDISNLSIFSRLLFIGMFSNADDEGRGRANINYLRSSIFPYDDITTKQVEAALEEIATHTSITLYVVEGNQYYLFQNWSKWQRVDKPKSSLIPLPDEGSEPNDDAIFNDYKNDSETNPGIIPDSFPPKGKEEKRKEKKIREEKRKGSAEGKEKQKTHPPLPDNFQNLSPPLKDKFAEWMQYKLERKEIYQPTGLRNLISEVSSNAKKYGDARVINIISQSMANGWKGIIWDRLSKEGGGAGAGTNQQPTGPPKRQVGVKL